MQNQKNSDNLPNKKMVKEKITERVQWYSELTGIKYSKIKINKAKTRWGSCSSKGSLNFNYRLYFAPLEILDYVVVHELSHIREMNHSKKFWNRVELVIPDYKKRRKWLRTEGKKLFNKST